MCCFSLENNLGTRVEGRVERRLWQAPPGLRTRAWSAGLRTRRLGSLSRNALDRRWALRFMESRVLANAARELRQLERRLKVRPRTGRRQLNAPSEHLALLDAVA